MSTFSDLDPTSADDPRLDPASDTARAVRAAAIVRGDEAPSTAVRRPRRLVPALAATGAAAAVALGVVLAGGSDGTPTDALAQAADETAETASSGVLTFTKRFGEADGQTAASTQVVRYGDGDASILEVLETTPSGGGAVTRTEREDLVVDGRHWVRKDGGDYVVKDAEAEGDLNDLRAFVRSETDNRPLVDLVRGDEDVQQDGSTWRATLAREDLAALERAPLELKDAPQDWGNEIPVALTIEDGLIAKVEVRAPKGIVSVEFDELGEPQAIQPPSAG